MCILIIDSLKNYTRTKILGLFIQMKETKFHESTDGLAVENTVFPLSGHKTHRN